MRLSYPKPRGEKTKTHTLHMNRLNGECYGKRNYSRATKLIIKRCSFDDGELNILKYYPSLEILEISTSNKIINFTAISHCPQLKTLSVEDTHIESIYGIEFCHDLKVVSLCRTFVPDLSILNGMGLTHLIINDLGDKPLKLPENLPELTILKCHFKVSDRFIPSYPNLFCLSLSGKDIEEIGIQPTVVNVYIENTGIRNLNFLRGAPVEHVHCNNNALETIDALEGSSISVLNCNDNKLNKLTSMPNLIQLECAYNKIFTLEDLENSPYLEFICCSGNSLLNLKGLEKLRKLKVIVATHNDIFDINAIRFFPRVDLLNLEDNMIMYLPKLRFLDNIQKNVYVNFNVNFNFNFNSNYIEDITHLERKLKCRNVSFSNNPLNDDSIEMLQKLSMHH
jgi:Leucine-rich repeat (LRR) protein